MATSITGASVWEQELFDHVTAHAENESAIIDEYRNLATEASSPAFRYLAALILADEVRHHRLFSDLAEAIRQMAELRDEDDPIPRLHGLAADRELVLETTERFLRLEEEDARELKHLAKSLRDVRDTTLWTLLVQLMLDDTTKHIRILRFIRDAVDRA